MIVVGLALAALVFVGAGIALAGRTKAPWRVRLLSLLGGAIALGVLGPRLALELTQLYVDWKAPAFAGIDPALNRFEARVVVEGLEAPVHVTHAGDGSGRLFVVEQWGRVRIVKDGALLEAPFLDLGDEVWAGGECGLLSIAFHPDYGRNGRAFVNFTRKRGALETVIAEVARSADPDRAAPGYRELLVFTQPYANHNGGLVAFGPDGLLYVGTVTAWASP